MHIKLDNKNPKLFVNIVGNMFEIKKVHSLGSLVR